VIATGGDRSHEWLEILTAFLRDMAENEKCAGVTMAGRPGWARKLTKFGFKTDMVSMRMEIENGHGQSTNGNDATDSQHNAI
jgi:hypothetical protein